MKKKENIRIIFELKYLLKKLKICTYKKRNEEKRKHTIIKFLELF